MIRETLFDSGENADVGVGVAFALRPRAVITEERFDTIDEVGRLFPIDMDDQG